MAQEEEGLGREQRRKANDAIREAKALREELHRLKEDRTVSFSRLAKGVFSFATEAAAT